VNLFPKVDHLRLKYSIGGKMNRFSYCHKNKMLFHDLGNEKIIQPLSLDSRVHFYNFEKLTVNQENQEENKLNKGTNNKN
jgi:hypothetical protein